MSDVEIDKFFESLVTSFNGDVNLVSEIIRNLALRYGSNGTNHVLIVETIEPATTSFVGLRLAQAGAKFYALRPGESLVFSGGRFVVSPNKVSLMQTPE